MRRPLTVAVVAVVLLGAAGILVLVAGDGDGSDQAAPTTLPATVADIGFLQDMSDHHAQALVLAGHAARRATDPAVRGLALEILGTQAEERGRMAALLADRGAGAGDPDRVAMGWAGEPSAVGDMAGMVPADQLAAFLALDSEAVDRRFVELMLEHHRGGVAMAAHARAHVTDPAILDLAGRMEAAQQREIAQLELLAG